ncbi:MAG: hypothetical protein ACFCVA_05865 [Gammaproteobacteria bacterium]
MTETKIHIFQSLKSIMVVFFTSLLMACASSPPIASAKKPEQKHSAPTPIAKDRLFSFPFEKVWGAAVQVFSETEFDPEIMDSASGVIKSKPSYILGRLFSDKPERLDHWPKKYEAQASVAPKSYLINYASCPSWSLMPFAIENLSIYVTKEAETQTKVVVMYQPQSMSVIYGARECSPTGVMEKKILDSIFSKLNQSR